MAQQPCSGSLGTNLFESGDFGTGTENVISMDPKIAPGYRYIYSGAPNDGEYLITNDVRNWTFVYDTWLRIGDNSSDPKGYMMVINASFEPGLFYEEIITDICDNTSFQFSADVINMVRRPVPGHILPNVAFLINDEVVLQTGDIPQDERWHTYYFNFTTVPGQTSVKLSLRNNAPGGIGNDLALDNISFQACGPPAKLNSDTNDDILCKEELPIQLTALIDGKEDPTSFYLWQQSNAATGPWTDLSDQSRTNITISNPVTGTTYYRFAFAGSESNFTNEKCRFFSDLDTVNIPQSEFEVFDTICGGTAIAIAGDQVMVPGIYTERLMSSLGCDSVITYYIDTLRRQTIITELSFENPICYDSNDGQVFAEKVMNGYPPYNLNVNGTDIEGLMYDELSGGDHIIQVKDRYGCFFEEVITLFLPEQFTIDLGENIEVLLGETVSIDISSNLPVAEFTTIPNITPTSDMSFKLLPLSDMVLQVVASDNEGCIAADSLYISVDEDVTIYLPNAFSPNADGKNDLYNISAIGRSIESIEVFDIYTRWGEKVADKSSVSATEGWDGTTHGGQYLNPGVYTVHIVLRLINGVSIERTGTLSLIR